jgi:hypothetical protein
LSTLLGVPIREDTLSTDHQGEEKPKTRKRAEEVVEKLQEVLRKAVGPEEAVLYVARCQAPVSPFEQLTFGWYIYYVTATVLVFTNRRLLHFDVTRKGTWKRMLRAVSWGDIDQAKVTGWLSKYLELKYRTGKKERYWRLSREDGNKIKVLLEAIFAAGGRESTAAETVTSLCPDCLAELAPRVYNCPRCGLVFKDEKTMVRRSLLIPGGGYFYTGHWFLAIGDFLVEAYLLVLVVVFALFAVGVLVDTSTQPGEAPLAGGAAWIAAGFVAAILAIEKLLTIHHCKRFVHAFMPSR